MKINFQDDYLSKVITALRAKTIAENKSSDNASSGTNQIKNGRVRGSIFLSKKVEGGKNLYLCIGQKYTFL
jgi:hypothetical protein